MPSGGGPGNPADPDSDESTAAAQSTGHDDGLALDLGRGEVQFRAIAPGTQLGRYQIVDELGAGGMATVWRARDRELRREVAIKALFPHLLRKADVVRRFDREARAAALLEHPNILRVYDVGGGTDPGGDPPYIVMELVRGQSLRDIADKHAPMLAEAVACIGALLCDALAVAHAAGVVHRDVKPGNAMVASGGRLLLADFGVAHIEDDDSLVTRTGALLGTPSFMSPEQASGGPLDGRSDIYSVGATLFQLATGALPFTGSTARVVAQLLRGEKTEPLRRCPSMGAPLARAIEAMMAVDPAARPATAAAAAQRLRAIAAAGGVEDVDAEVASLVADPAAYRARRAPEVLARVKVQADAAVARRAWPEAIALADRAAALAPDDASVAALVARVAAGGRRKVQAAMVAAVAGALAIAGGVGVALLGGGGGDGVRDGGGVGDGGGGGVGDGGGGFLIVSIDAGVDAAALAVLVDAAPQPAQVAVRPGGRRIAPLPPPPDAAVASIPPDAAPVALPVEAPAPAQLTLAMDAWCNVTVDGTPHGRADRRRPIALAPGRHDVVCSQGPGLGDWHGVVELAAGQARTVTGSLLRPVAVSVALDDGDAAAINGVIVRDGASTTLRPGRHRIEILRGGRPVSAGWVSVPRVARCALRDRPTLDCYQTEGPKP